MEPKLHPVREAGTLTGFKNMLRIEGSHWLSLRTLMIHSIGWLLGIQFAVVMPLIVAPIIDHEAAIVSLDMAVEVFITIFAMVTAVGSLIVMQSVLVGENQSGTAAWILTNPITRTSFILSKLFANSVALIFMTVLLQGAVGYGVMSYSIGYLIPVRAYLVSMGLQTLHILFYITLSLALGSFFNSRGAILGIGIMFIMIQDYMGSFIGSYLPWFPYVLPSMLNKASILVNIGQPLESLVPAAATVAYILVFTGFAIWRFNKTEF